MPKSKGRGGRPWVRRSAALRARAKAQNVPCSACGLPIDWSAEPRSRWSFSVDHVVPLSHDGAPLDPTNLAVMHVGCNSRKGNRVGHTVPQSPVTSRRW